MITDNIKSLIINTVGWLSCLTIIFFFSTLWLYSYNNIDQAFHEAWSTSVAFLSALATLSAAIVAASLFNDWKVQHNKQTLAEEAKNLIKIVDRDVQLLSFIKSDLKKSNFNNFLIDQQEITLDIFNLFDDLQENQNQITSNSGLFYNISADEELNRIIADYQNSINSISLYFIEQVRASQETNIVVNTMVQIINISVLKNGVIKKYLKNYIIIK